MEYKTEAAARGDRRPGRTRPRRFLVVGIDAVVLGCLDMTRRIYFITGSDTGVGKTVLTTLLAAHLLRRNVRVAALKPVCSGGREDAGLLREALRDTLPLDTINPWHFRAPLAPRIAARREGKTVLLRQVVSYVRRVAAQGFQVLLIEGAGGLLSPLGEDFDSRDLIVALHATSLVVCPNRLGAINQALLTIGALPVRLAAMARVALMSQQPSDGSSHSNAVMLRDTLGSDRVQTLPWLDEEVRSGQTPPAPAVRQKLDALLR